MEAVLERPELDIPEFDEAEHARQMGAAGIPEAEPEDHSNLLGASFAQALGIPESLEDIWPGYAYQPPKIKHMETLVPLTEEISRLWNSGERWASVNKAVDAIAFMARKQEGIEYRVVTRDEVAEALDEDQAAEILNHILTKQGVRVEAAEGNALSGRLIGLKNFQRSAASIISPLANGPTSPSPSTSD